MVPARPGPGQIGVGETAASAERHEAAHAVVAVRVGLHLAFTDIRERPFKLRDGRRGVAGGYTQVSFENPESKARLAELARPRAVYTAAGIAAERHVAKGKPDEVTIINDLKNVRVRAAELGITTSALPAFIEECVVDAMALLLHDGGLAWDRVTVALRRHKILSGDKVRLIVAEADATTSASDPPQPALPESQS